MEIVNLTPHTINILRDGPSGPEEVLSVPPSGQLARLAVSREEVNNVIFANGRSVSPGDDSFGGIAFFKSVFGEPAGLPSQEEGTIFIVSSLFRSGFDREDLWVPGELIRNDDGIPIGCMGLSR